MTDVYVLSVDHYAADDGNPASWVPGVYSSPEAAQAAAERRVPGALEDLGDNPHGSQDWRTHLIWERFVIIPGGATLLAATLGDAGGDYASYKFIIARYTLDETEEE